MAGSAFRAAVEAQDLDAATALLADEVTFNSPVVHKPYSGRETVATILRTAFSVFEDFRYTDEQGRIVDFTVMVRPASGLMALGERMGAALAEAGVTPPRR